MTPTNIMNIITTNIFKNTRLITLLGIALCAIFLVGCSNLDIQTLNNKAAQLMAQGDIDGAIARLQSIQDLNPNFPQTNYNLGIAYKEKKNLDKSQQYLERAVQLKPNLYQAHLALSVVYEELADKLIQSEMTKLGKENQDTILSTENIIFATEQREKLYNYYNKAKLHLEDYLKYSPAKEDNEALKSKLNQYEDNINKYSLSESKPEKTLEQNEE